MKKLSLTIIIALINFTFLRAQTIPTTTITGNLKVNDSLHVVNNISTAGDVKATGEIISKDTMRAEKDVLINGNASVGGNLKVAGTTTVGNLRVGGNLSFGPYPPYTPGPCELSAVMVVPDPSHSGGSILTPIGPTMAHDIETAYDLNPCAQPQPAPPIIIPFTWQTYGNNVNSNNRWIGTIENFDFNIKTNSSYQVVCKANGDIGLGAFGGNVYNTNGKKYRMFVSNTGEVSAGVQDANSKYPFVIKPNGAVTIGVPTSAISSYMLNVNGTVNIGTPFATTSPYMLTVNGRIGAREIKVSIQNPWPDYVFNKNYKLQSLENVEAYIIKNNHLPNIPATEDLKKEECGLDLAQMQGMQMEKIEEIYLHLIELNKQVKELKKENELLKQQLIK